MLLSSGLPRTFWGEALTTAAYIINKTSSSAIMFKAPDEIWFDKPVSYGYLKPFGCLAFAHKRGDELEPRADRCVLLGYPNNTKGYRLWNMNTKKVTVSRDVVFMEEEIPYLARSKNKGEETLSDAVLESDISDD